MRRGAVAARVLLLALALGAVALGASLVVSRRAGPSSRGGAIARAPGAQPAGVVEPAREPGLRGESLVTERMRGGAPEPGSSERSTVLRVDPQADEQIAVRVTGRVLDRQDRAVPGAWLADETDGILATTDDAGLFDERVEVVKPVGFGVELGLVIGAPGRVSVVRTVPVEQEATIRLGTVILEPGLVVQGRVTLASGAPAAGVEVRYAPGSFPLEELEDLWQQVETVPTARTAADGSFRLAGLPRRDLTLVVDAGAGRLGAVAIEGAGREEVTGLELVLAPRDGPAPIEGVVLQPDGSPAAGARVRSVSNRFGFSLQALLARPDEVLAGEDGRFVILPERDRTQQLEALPPPGLEARSASASAEPGARGVELRLLPAARIEVAVTGASGDLLPWSRVMIGGERYALGETGRASLPLPTARFHIRAWAPGYRQGQAGPFDPEELERAGEPVAIVLEPGGRVLGRVVSRGRPVPGARIKTGGAFWKAWFVSMELTRLEEPFLFRSTFVLDPHDAESDSEGRFLLSVHVDASLPLLVRAEGFPPTVFGPFELSQESTTEVELELVTGGALEGRVLVRDGESAAGRIVGACPGWGVLWTAAVTEEGTYRIDGLPPGDYQVRECVFPVAAFQGLSRFYPPREAPEIRVDAVVRSGEATTFDLDLREVGSVVLEGSVGFAPAGTRVFLLPWDVDSPHDPLEIPRYSGATVATAEVNEDGSFRMEVSEPGRHELGLLHGGTLIAEVYLIRGTNTWALDFEPGSLRLLSGDPEALARRCVTLSWEDPARGLRWSRQRWPSPGKEPILEEGLPPGLHRMKVTSRAQRALAALGYAGDEEEAQVRDVELDVEVVSGRETVVELGNPGED